MAKRVVAGALLAGVLLCAPWRASVVADDGWETRRESVSAQTAAVYASVDALREEVSLLNLVNGLHLSKGQMQQIISLAQEARALRDEHLEKRAVEVKKFEAALGELRQTLSSADPQIAPALEKSVQGQEAALHAVLREYFGKLCGVEQRLSAVLTTAQLEVVRRFNPCLIPPRDLKDPVRVGQAEGEFAEIEIQIEHLRDLPEKPFNVVIGPLLDAMVRQFGPYLGVNSEQEHAAEKERLLGIMRRARALSDAEFALEKENLARGVVKRVIDLQDKVRELTEVFTGIEGGLSKTGKFLLNPRIVPLLEARLKLLASQPQLAQQDLDRITPAPICRKGGCTLPHVDPETLKCRCGKPTFAWFADAFHLSGEAATQARATLAAAQVEMLDLLSLPREDGTTPLGEMFRLGASGKEENAGAEFVKLMFARVPGGNVTYFARFHSIKQKMNESLKRVMRPEDFERYRRANVEILELHVGNLSR